MGGQAVVTSEGHHGTTRPGSPELEQPQVVPGAVMPDAATRGLPGPTQQENQLNPSSPQLELSNQSSPRLQSF